MFSQNRRFCKTGAKSEQKGSKNDLKIELWALGGSTFVILGGFLKRQIFDEFSMGKKTVKNLQKCGALGPEGRPIAIWLAGRREGRGSWNLLRIQESCKFSTGSCTLTPLQAGGGGFKGFASCRRPWKIRNCSSEGLGLKRGSVHFQKYLKEALNIMQTSLKTRIKKQRQIIPIPSKNY